MVFSLMTATISHMPLHLHLPELHEKAELKFKIKEWVYIPLWVYNPIQLVVYNLKLSPSNIYSYVVVCQLNTISSYFGYL